jgi:hypothetical protein
MSCPTHRITLLLCMHKNKICMYKNGVQLQLYTNIKIKNILQNIKTVKYICFNDSKFSI